MAKQRTSRARKKRPYRAQPVGAFPAPQSTVPMERPMERKKKAGTVLCGLLTVGLLVLTGYLAGSAVGHLGLIGRQLGLRVEDCRVTSSSTPRGGGRAETEYACSGVVASGGRTRRMTAYDFTSDPSFTLSTVKVSQEPWGTWVPVDHGAWNQVGRALSPLIPLGFAYVFAKGALIGYRRWRNSSRLPTGSCE